MTERRAKSQPQWPTPNRPILTPLVNQNDPKRRALGQTHPLESPALLEMAASATLLGPGGRWCTPVWPDSGPHGWGELTVCGVRHALAHAN